MPSNTLSIWLPQVIIESILIVLSILVALGLDSWRQNKEDEEFVRTALSNFLIEIQRNKTQLEVNAPFNIGLRKVMNRHYLEGDLDTVDEFVSMVESYGPATLRQTAWDTALATGSLAKMDYDLVTALSHTYSLQDRYDVTTRTGLSELTSALYLSEETLQLAVYNSVRFLNDTTTLEMDLEVVYVEASRVVETALRELDGIDVDELADDGNANDPAHP